MRRKAQGYSARAGKDVRQHLTSVSPPLTTGVYLRLSAHCVDDVSESQNGSDVDHNDNDNQFGSNKDVSAPSESGFSASRLTPEGC